MDYPNSGDLYDNKFTDGDPVAGIPASVASADHMNAVYDELKALIAAGGIVSGTADLAQVAKSIGNQLRSKQVFDVSGTADAIILTTPSGKQPVTSLTDFDEFSFIVTATNTSSTVTIKIDELDVVELSGISSDTQIFETALLTVRYISGAFYIVDQVNLKTGNSVLDIAKLYTDTVDILRPGEYALDGSSLSRSDHPIAFAIVSASSNYIDQAMKDADSIVYGGYYGDGDGLTTFTLPMVGGEFIRMFDDGRGADSGRVFGSHQDDAIRNIIGEINNMGAATFSGLTSAGAFGPKGPDTLSDYIDGTTNTTSKYSDFIFDASTVVPTADENRPRNIAYHGKTRL